MVICDDVITAMKRLMDNFMINNYKSSHVEKFKS